MLDTKQKVRIMKNTGVQEENKLRVTCPMEYAMNKIAGKWKLVILWHIYDQEVIRYGELQRLLDKISHKMLSNQLKELLADGIIHKEVYKEIPPKVEYSLTDFGKTLIPIMDSLFAWGQENRPDMTEL
jgi:DNA-binding HxlR family transcriptional regulator